MQYPAFLKSHLTIGFPAPSCGIRQKDTLRYNNSILKLKKLGYNIVTSQNQFNTEHLVSTTAKDRAQEFTTMWQDQSIDFLLSIAGGEFMCEILPHLDINVLKAAKPKFFMGFSDNTIINHMLLTWLNVASIYHYTSSYFGMNKWHSSVKDGYNLMTSKSLSFTSYGKYQDEKWQVPNKELASLNLTKKVAWKNARGEKQITMTGRMIGGCIDVLLMYLGTPYDKTKEFLETYKNDGFVWFLESCDLSVPEVKRAVWQLKNNGWFKYVKGFVFGRPKLNEPVANLSYEKAVMEIIEDLNVPVIFDADFGHKPPAIPIIVGSIGTITCANNKGSMSFELK